MRRFVLLASCILAPMLLGAGRPRAIAYLGIEFRWAGDTAAAQFLHVERVAPQSPAASAGIRPGDLITHVAGVRVDFGDELDFLLFMRQRRPGERLTMTVVRSGKAVQRVVTLAALPEASRARWEHNFRMAQERRAAARHATRRK